MAVRTRDAPGSVVVVGRDGLRMPVCWPEFTIRHNALPKVSQPGGCNWAILIQMVDNAAQITPRPARGRRTPASGVRRGGSLRRRYGVVSLSVLAADSREYADAAIPPCCPTSPAKLLTNADAAVRLAGTPASRSE